MNCSRGHTNPTGTSYCIVCGEQLGSFGTAVSPSPAPLATGGPSPFGTGGASGSLEPAGYFPPPAIPMVPSQSQTRGMYTAAAVLNWVTLAIIVFASFGIGIIAAAWYVPMTILTHKAAKGPYKHTALGVCTLLFVNLISGILMLVDDSNRPPKPM